MDCSVNCHGPGTDSDGWLEFYYVTFLIYCDKDFSLDQKLF